MEKGLNQHTRWALTKKPNLTWVRDSLGLILFAPGEERYWILPGLEGDLWDYVALNRPYRELVFLTASSLNSTPEQAIDFISATFQKWHSQGLARLERIIE